MGLQDEWDATRSQLSYFFPWLFQSFPKPTDHASPTATASLKARHNVGHRAESAAELPTELREVIERHNKMDIQLYQFAVQRFKQQADQIRSMNDGSSRQKT